MQLCNCESTQIHKNISMEDQKNVSFQVCNYATIWVCQHMTMHLWEYASNKGMYVCNYASSQLYTDSLQILILHHILMS